jgi:hypothetical protein
MHWYIFTRNPACQDNQDNSGDNRYPSEQNETLPPYRLFMMR